MYKLRVKNVIPQPGNNITFQFEPLDNDFPSYKAGQFLSLKFHFGEREIRRSYSLNSSPDVNEPLGITVKRVENGEISRFLHHTINVGDVLETQNPSGVFVYEPDELKERTVFLFAAGVGITPIFSILKTALVREKKSKIILIYSNSSPETVIFSDEIKSWQNKYPDRLEVIWIFSNSKNLLTARLNPVYIEEIVNKYLVRKEDTIFYTCGPVLYMDLCRMCLIGLGFDIRQIKRETFVLPEDELDDDDQVEKVVDKNSYSVKLLFNKKSYNLLVPYNKTILDVALEHKINLPYSCRSGMCRTCEASCKSGSVRMDYNEVLLDEEVQSGQVLVCTGHPKENNTIISYE